MSWALLYRLKRLDGPVLGTCADVASRVLSD